MGAGCGQHQCACVIESDNHRCAGGQLPVPDGVGPRQPTAGQGALAVPQLKCGTRRPLLSRPYGMTGTVRETSTVLTWAAYGACGLIRWNS